MPATVAEAPVCRRVPEGFPDDVLGVCWSSTLEAATAQERLPAVVDLHPLPFHPLAGRCTVAVCGSPELRSAIKPCFG